MFEEAAPDRRTLLRGTVAGIGAVILAGCSGPGDEEDGDDDGGGGYGSVGKDRPRSGSARTRDGSRPD